MVTTQSRRFEADLEFLSRLRRFAEDFSTAAGANQQSRNALVLILEELFTNTVEHGYPASSEQIAQKAVWISLAIQSDRIAVDYEDAAPAHDPLANAKLPDYSGSAETWPVGGLGTLLVKSLASDARYERAAGRNRIRFAIPLKLP